ncbi:MAG: methylated-DNA--[protein]-cysteine S-methyltransferase [Deltaproteobacteria bacterium]|nr:MAG: methylated-DNA--[protein]-cysteine S-methyltransferase [Deltaproteobacteria bacterium]
MNHKPIPYRAVKFSYVLTDTPVGPLGLHFTSKGLAALTFNDQDAAAANASPPPEIAAWVEIIKRGVDGYFHGRTLDLSSLPLDLRGTSFQLRVWRELRKIPWGQTISYKELAARAGSPKGFRAVGQANGANPIPLIIPCHRVINANGALGGFSSGLHRKKWLLEHEGAI